MKIAAAGVFHSDEEPSSDPRHSQTPEPMTMAVLQVFYLVSRRKDTFE